MTQGYASYHRCVHVGKGFWTVVVDITYERTSDEATAMDLAAFDLGDVNACHARLKESLRRFNGVVTKNLPDYLCWRRTLGELGQNAISAAVILGDIGTESCQQSNAIRDSPAGSS